LTWSATGKGAFRRTSMGMAGREQAGGKTKLGGGGRVENVKPSQNVRRKGTDAPGADKGQEKVREIDSH